MTRLMKAWAIGLVLVASLPAGLAAQRGPLRGGGAPGAAAGAGGNDAIAPAELQRMFDAYALLQAQSQLDISEDQYTRFLVRFKALQDVRRKALAEHTRLVIELRRLLNQSQAQSTDTTEAQLKEKMQALQDLDARSAADIRKAYDAIDQVLDVRQQARFRVFEELMERRKLELVTRARQANRQRQQQQQQTPPPAAPQP
jgi:hypothetical protein